MKHEDIKAHWADWAESYGTSLRATTKTSTLKQIELDALERAFNTIMSMDAGINTVLEVGTGNAENIIHLAKTFPNLTFSGMDLIDKMIESGKKKCADAGLSDERVRLFQGDLMDFPPELADQYDLIFTNRCIINLNSDDIQRDVVRKLCERISPGGFLVMVENNTKTFARQNHLRELLGLDPRKPAEFNHFIDEGGMLEHLRTHCDMDILDVEDHISLHDLMLYVLLPAINDGEIDYEHPLVTAATKLNISVSAEEKNAFGSFGQNRMYISKKLRSVAE